MGEGRYLEKPPAGESQADRIGPVEVGEHSEEDLDGEEEERR